MSNLLAILIVALIITHLFSGVKYDSTDPPDGRHSGLMIYIDHESGCQYITNLWGFTITPRLDKDGKIICVKK